MALTVTLQEAVFPFVVFTVTVAVPAATAVTVPLALTFTALVLLELHFKVVTAPLGLIVGISFVVFPSSMLKVL